MYSTSFCSLGSISISLFTSVCNCSRDELVYYILLRNTDHIENVELVIIGFESRHPFVAAEMVDDKTDEICILPKAKTPSSVYLPVCRVLMTSIKVSWKMSSAAV